MNKTKTFLYPLSIALLIPALNAQVTVDFVAETDYTAGFTVQNTSSADGIVWSDGTGVGGVAGRLDAIGSGNHNDNVFYSGAGAEIEKNYDDAFTASVMLYTGSAITTDVAQVQTGWLRSTGSVFNAYGGGYAFWGQLRIDGDGAYLRIYQTEQATGSAMGSSATFTLDPDSWYELRSTMKLQSDSVAETFSVTIYSRGADGTEDASLVESLSFADVSLPNGGFTGNLTAGLGGGNNSGSNIVALDAFSTFTGDGGGEESIWYGFEVLESGDANTGGWIGWINVINDPWIWSYALESYLYIGDGSGWAYVPK